MKKFYISIFTLLITSFSFGQDLVITGVFDGSLEGGVPKAIELYVINSIADLSPFGIGSANNGGGTDGVELVLSGSVNAGDFLYIASEQPQFNAYFGFDPDFVDGAASINGDDAIELFMNGTVIDIYGVIDVDGSGEAWEYTDGWAYRNNATGPDGTSFVSSNWTYSGIDVNDGETSNSTATTPFPIGTYTLGTAAVGRNEIQNFSMYPNPVVNGKLFINTASNSIKKIQIFDVLGKHILSTNLSGNELNLSDLNSGIYILKINEEDKTATRKLVIK